MPPPRVERRALARLPVSTRCWEVALVDVPISIENVALDGMLFVVEEDTGSVRSAGPIPRGGALWPVLGGAFRAPAPPGRPGLPRVLRTTADLRERLERELDGLSIRVETVDELVHVAPVVESLVRHLRPLRAPGLEVELPSWKRALSNLCRLAPWEALDDDVTFRFDGRVAELVDAVGVVLGRAGEQQGVVLYRSSADYEQFLAAALAGRHDLALGVEAICLYVDAMDEFDPGERAEIRRLGLALPDRRAPRTVALHGGEGRALTDREQRVLLVAIEAMLALCGDDPERLATRPHTKEASTCLGSVTVRSQPSERLPAFAEPLASDVAHAIIFTRVRHDHEDRPAEETEAIVLKTSKRDAEKIAARVFRADAAVVAPHPGGVRVTLLEGVQELGVLCDVPVDPEYAAQLARAATLTIAISAGGPKRPQLRRADLVLSLRLAVRAPGASRKHDPIFDRPPEEWPKISATLIRFAELALGPMLTQLEPEALQAALDMASAVWNGVILSDFCGAPGFLEETRRLVRMGDPGHIALVEVLIATKRQQFPGDPRVVGDVRVGRRRGQPWLTANAALPSGYEVGR